MKRKFYPLCAFDFPLNLTVKMEYVVDIQCFKRSSNVLIVKEWAIVPLIDTNVKPSVFLFESPCSWNKLLEEEVNANRWIEIF